MTQQTLKELNKQKMYTLQQLQTLAKFSGKYLNTYPHHLKYWVDGTGYVTVYEVRGVTSKVKENYEAVQDIGS